MFCWFCSRISFNFRIRSFPPERMWKSNSNRIKTHWVALGAMLDKVHHDVSLRNSPEESLVRGAPVSPPGQYTARQGATSAF